MKQLRLRGAATALVTPFSDGAVDYQAYEALVKMQLSAGMDFIVPLGTTAETPCLEDAEKLRLLEITRELAADIPVVAGCGTNSLTKTVANIRAMEPYSPDAFLVVVPYYNKPVQEGLYQYFKAVAEATDKAIVLYNVPGRTGQNMTAETTLRLAEIPNIVAVKEASGKVDQISEIIRNAPEGFSVLSGNDDQTAELIRLGADGLISVVSNMFPEKIVALVHALLEGNEELAGRLDTLLRPLFHACFVESNPIAVKGGMSLMGLCRNELRLPLTPAAPSTLELMREVIATL